MADTAKLNDHQFMQQTKGSNMKKMTGRERLRCILNRQPADRLSWTTLADDVTRSGMPDEVRRLSPIEFYRSIGCDIVQLGNYGLSADLAVPQPSRLVCPEVSREIEMEENGQVVRRRLAPSDAVAIGVGGPTKDSAVTLRRITPWGTLTAALKHDHPVEYPVNSYEDLRILRAIWEASDYVEDLGMEPALARLESLIGDAGMYVPALDPSPVQYLLEYEMGPANFFYLLSDYPAEVEELLAVMHAKRLKEYDILARRSPCAVVIPIENTSSTLISPALYRTYSLPQVRDYVDILHQHGKKAVLHMCGHLKALLPDIRKTGLDGINACTPPPVGATFYEDVLDAYGEDFLLFGAILSPSMFHNPAVGRAELHAFLEQLYTPRLRQANMVIWLQADCAPTPLEKFLAVRDWMLANPLASECLTPSRPTPTY
jgi:hypothetical protein